MYQWISYFLFSAASATVAATSANDAATILSHAVKNDIVSGKITNDFARNATQIQNEWQIFRQASSIHSQIHIANRKCIKGKRRTFELIIQLFLVFLRFTSDRVAVLPTKIGCAQR